MRLTRQSERTSFQQLKKLTAQALALPLWGRDGDDTQRQQQIQHGDGADGVSPNFMNDFCQVT